MHNIKLTLAYDGTDFYGWQIQPERPTIQGLLVDVACKLAQERIMVHGAGRTDAGVHALGQVCHFKTQSHLTPIEFQRAFNALLPPTIRVVAAEEVEPDFHARRSAMAKTYRYRIYRGRIVPPFVWRYVLHYPYPLNEAAMMEAARLFEGEHDFTSFAAPSGAEDDDHEHTTVRTILRSELEHAPEELAYVVRGRSFLRHMVRKMVGMLMDVGRGRLSPADVPKVFEMRDRSRSGPTVPPRGLCMESVEYPEPRRMT